MTITNAQLIDAETALAEISDMILPAAVLWSVLDLSSAVTDALRPYRAALGKLLERHAPKREGAAPPVPLVDSTGKLIAANARDPEALMRDVAELVGQRVEMVAAPLRREAFVRADFSGRPRPFVVLAQVGLLASRATPT